jgi:hypothetical protein
MKTGLMAAASAAAIALLLSAPVQAQQLREQVASGLARASIDVPNLDALSDTQITQMNLILSSSETDCCKADQISALMATPGPCVATAQLREQVMAKLASDNIRIEGMEVASGAKLALVNAVLSSTETREGKAAQIERIFATQDPILGNDQLRAEAEQCVTMVNASVDLTAMTPEELVQIELISSGDGSAEDKRTMIEQLAN